MDNVPFPCNVSTNDSILINPDDDSLSNVARGVWLLFVISAFGIVNSCTTLLIFTKLGWYKKRQYLLLLTLTVVDLMNSVTFISGSTTQLVQLYFDISNILTETLCFLVWLPSNVAMTCSPVLAFFVATDRLYCILYPVKWITMRKSYWRSLVIVAWGWALVVQGGWLFFTSFALCVKACTFVPFPNRWWSWVVRISDIVVNVAVIVMYIVIPQMAAIAMKSCRVNFKTKAHDDILLQHKAMIGQIRAMSAITIICFTCTYGISFLLADFNYLAGVGGPTTAMIVQQITACMLSCNSTISFILYTVKDQSFRREAFNIFFSIFDPLKMKFKSTPEIKVNFVK